MIKFVIRQVFISVQLLLGVSIIVFVLISIYPTDPVASLFGPHGSIGRSGQDTEEILRRLSGDTLGPVRYLFWMKEVLTGNLGVSLLTPRPVAEVIGQAIPVTVGLTVVALGVAALAGAAIGMFSAGSERSILIRSLSALPIFFASVPTAFLALWGLYVFAVRLHWLPALGLWTPGGDTGFNLDLLHHAILPTMVLALPCIAIYMRYAQQSILHEQPQGPEQAEAAHGSQDLLVRSRRALRRTMAPLARKPPPVRPGTDQQRAGGRDAALVGRHWIRGVFVAPAARLRGAYGGGPCQRRGRGHGQAAHRSNPRMARPKCSYRFSGRHWHARRAGARHR